MTDDAHCVDVIECPEHFCTDIWSGREELEAHLRLDHNRSEFKAEKLADQVLKADTEQRGDRR